MIMIVKVISPQAYNALREALPLIFWFKQAFETYVRAAFGDYPELLAGISFQEPKRESASHLMERLMADVGRYREVTITVMLDVAAMTDFPDIQKIRDAKDRENWLEKARQAVANLRRHTAGYTVTQSQTEKRKAAKEARERESIKVRKFADDLNEVKNSFVNLRQMADKPQERGREFERVLNSLFAIYDMQPKLGYVLETEQIDGAITFDTDDFIVEAKWTKDPIGRGELDIFAAKVNRRGKNALGLFISQSDFTSAALTEYARSTPFLAMTGQDLYFVLEGRVRLDELLRAKKRHANETGDCMLAAATFASTS